MTAAIQQYEVYACLPFVAIEKQIKLGPVIFWPASKYREFIAPEHQKLFHSYIETIGQIKAKTAGQQSYINTIKVNPDATCISLDSTIAEDKRNGILTDALYLLYFASTYQDLYISQAVSSFNSFRKLIPADLPFIRSAENWQNLFIREKHREETITLKEAPKEVYVGLGNLLKADGEAHLERVIRAICYLVDRFYPRFVNIVEKGLDFNDKLNAPEDILILSASFDALLDINEDQRSSDFKHKVRPLLNLRYVKSLELFWKWVDDFYVLRKKILRGDESFNTHFTLNPNLDVPHLLVGLKMFIYIVFFTLYQYRLMEKLPDELNIPVDEVLIFFWSEENILKKIERYLEQPSTPELKEEIHYLADLFLMIQRKFGKSGNIAYIPTPNHAIEKDIKAIIALSEKNPSVQLPPEFISKLRAKL